MNESITLVTFFAPGRKDIHDLWLDAVSKLQIDKIILVNNSNEEINHSKIKRPINIVRYSKSFADKSSRDKAEQFAEMWNLITPIIDTDYVLSLEDDIIPCDGFLSKMTDEMTHDIGIIGLPIRSRHSKCVMAYNCISIEPWKLDRKYKVQGKGLTRVDSVSLSCTLFRSILLRNFQFTGYTGGNGHEWSLMRHCAFSNLKVYCDFDLSAKHHITMETWL